MSSESLIERAARSAEVLRKLNRATLVVAGVVYVGLLVVAVVNGIIPLAIFASCIMLAEVLVFQIVRTLLDHLAVIRLRATTTTTTTT